MFKYWLCRFIGHKYDMKNITTWTELDFLGNDIKCRAIMCKRCSIVKKERVKDL